MGLTPITKSFLLTLALMLTAAPAIWAQPPSTNDGDVSNLEADIRTLRSSALKEDRIAAAEKCGQAIALVLQAGDKTKAAQLLNIQGTIWMTVGDYSNQLGSYRRALEIYESLGDDDGAALSLMNIGDALVTAGEHEQALEYLERAIPKFRASRNAYFEAVASWTIGGIYAKLGRLEKAIGFFREANRIKPSADYLNEIAMAYDQLGRWRDALTYYQKAIAIQSKGGEKFGLAKTYSYLGSHFARQKKFKIAHSNFARSIELNRTLPRTHAYEHQFAGTTTQIGIAYADEGNFAAALRSFDEAGKIYRQIGDAEGEGLVLRSLGNAHATLREFEKSRADFLNEIVVNRRSGDRVAEAIAIDSVRAVSMMAGDRRVAILFGKKAINEFQELRGAIKGLDAETRRAYLTKFEASYKSVADLLIAEGRLPEAQAVLAMLKEEEVLEYVQRDAAEADKLSQRADLRDDEKAALAKYEDLAGRISSIGTEFAKLKAKREAEPLDVADQKRYDELAAQLEQSNTVFQVFLRELSDEFSKRPKVVDELQENAGLQSDLKSWGDGVVALYTIVGDDRYRVILTTSEIQIDGKSEIKAVDLNMKISAFRAAVQNPRVDPRPLGKELYDIIVKPIEAQLAGANAKTLLWSLDGALRYVPMAALWDGKQYFGQKYRNVIITLASRTRLSQEPVGNWKMLGLGVSEAKRVTEPNGSGVMNFPALPSVKTELSSIIRESEVESGVITGNRRVDDQFTEKSLATGLAQRYQVVHIASHFSFRPGDMTRSFLLLGDGTPLTMDKFKRSPELKFNGVELLTLSACNTAVGEAGANGREVESFAVIAQQNGAKAVMATLWPVADESTALFMTEFYRIKKEQPSITKAEAIRLAQKEMIDGKIKSSGRSNGCRAEEFAPGAQKTEFKCDPNAPYSHPYFWSPFVLIGNWR